MSSTPSPGDRYGSGPRIGAGTRFLAAVLGAFLATACGQRGPLYLPEDTAPARAEAAAEQDATENDSKREEDDEATPGT